MPHILEELRSHGILLKTDSRLPNVCALVAGEAVHGSWWAHPRSYAMFRALGDLASHRDVLVTKLISGKDTFVHRGLWPLFLSVAMGHEDWQFGRLDQDSRALVVKVEQEGTVEATGPDAATVERALLVHCEQVHTAKGSHAKVLTSWARWVERAHAPPPDLAPDDARESLDNLVSFLNTRYGGRGTLPWQRFSTARQAS